MSKLKVKAKKVKSDVYSFTGHEFELISVAGATLWQYCLDTKRPPSDFAKGIQGLSKLIDSPEKAEAICADKVLLIGVFTECVDGIPVETVPTE